MEFLELTECRHSDSMACRVWTCETSGTRLRFATDGQASETSGTLPAGRQAMEPLKPLPPPLSHDHRIEIRILIIIILLFRFLEQGHCPISEGCHHYFYHYFQEPT